MTLRKGTERKVREEKRLIDNKQYHHTKRLLGKFRYETRKIVGNDKTSFRMQYIEYA